MKSRTNFMIFLGCVIFSYAVIAALCFKICNTRNDVSKIAVKALTASVSNPEDMVIVSVSKPDSVYGKYLTLEDRMFIADKMMKYSKKVEEATGDFDKLDLDNPQISEMLNRQISVSAAIRPLMIDSYADIDELKRKPKGQFSGWKVVIEYKAKSETGQEYQSQYWAFLDKDATCVLRSFELPIK